MSRIPTSLDRYPAKMVSHLATSLIQRYAGGASSLFDPFSGSCAVLSAARSQGILTLGGCDINPLSELYASVKINGFNLLKAEKAFNEICSIIKSTNQTLPIELNTKNFWFTAGTVRKLESLRFAIRCCDSLGVRERSAILLALTLSVRPCSRADQRSPKPFISKGAISTRKGKHFDPVDTMRKTLTGLYNIHGEGDRRVKLLFRTGDNTRKEVFSRLGGFSHAITSPPYINAQDYFRNFKLELFTLEGLMPFSASSIRENFIGTERGELDDGLSKEDRQEFRDRFSEISEVENSSARHAKIVFRYIGKMREAIRNTSSILSDTAKFVVVCGDNLVAGVRIPTVAIVSSIIESAGFSEFDRFEDPIRDRLLAPSRLGHRGIIKNETIVAFERHRVCLP